MVSKYTKELLQAAVSTSISMAGVLRRLGFAAPSGSMVAHIKSRILAEGIDISHFTGLPEDPSSRSGRKTIDHTLVRGTSRRLSSVRLTRILQELGVAYQCNICALPPLWEGRPLMLVVDHVDGDWSNNLRENLRFLCSNCHSQTPTFGAKNIEASWSRRSGHAPVTGEIAGSTPVEVVHTKPEYRNCAACDAKLYIHGPRLRYRNSFCNQACSAKYAERVEWPPDLNLVAEISTTSIAKVAARLGVSWTAVKHRLSNRKLANRSDGSIGRADG